MSNEDLEEIARTCHEVNRAYCIGLGDFSQKPWNRAPDWQRMSAIAGVRATLAGDITSPEESHENWMAHKEADGWVYGDVKDIDAKTHPCLVPYAELPLTQRTKDILFHAVIDGLRHPGPA